MRSLIAIAAVTLVSAVGPAALPDVGVAHAAGVPGSGIGIGAIDDPGQPYIVVTVEPGDVITRTVRVQNNTGAGRAVSVYAGPAFVDNGVFTDEVAGTANALTSWTTVDKPLVQLADGQGTDVAVTITVPRDAPSAQLFGAVWADVDGSRSGVRMYVTVAGDNGPAADFTIDDLVAQRASDGVVTVLARVTVVGGRPIDLTGSLRLTDGVDGGFTGVVPARPTTLAAHAGGSVPFVLPGSASLPPGTWTARMRLRNGYFTHDLSRPFTVPDAPSTGGGGSTSSLGSLGGS